MARREEDNVRNNVVRDAVLRAACAAVAPPLLAQRRARPAARRSCRGVRG